MRQKLFEVRESCWTTFLRIQALDHTWKGIKSVSALQIKGMEIFLWCFFETCEIFEIANGAREHLDVVSSERRRLFDNLYILHYNIEKTGNTFAVGDVKILFLYFFRNLLSAVTMFQLNEICCLFEYGLYVCADVNKVVCLDSV